MSPFGAGCDINYLGPNGEMENSAAQNESIRVIVRHSAPGAQRPRNTSASFQANLPVVGPERQFPERRLPDGYGAKRAVAVVGQIIE